MIYCFDIDGTICETDGMNYHDSLPKRECIDQVNMLYDQGHTIIFFTARGMGTLKGDTEKVHQTWNDFTVTQLEKWGVNFHQVITGKPAADVYVDDRAVSAADWFQADR